MKSILPATHLLGRLVLFTLTLIFLSTMARSAYVLWHFFDVEQSGALLAVFVTGLRNDIAAAALVCLIPASLGFLFALSTWTRFLSKAIFVITLLGGLVLLLVLELITPWFMEMQGIRPDLAAVLAVQNPIAEIEAAARRWPIPMAIGVLLLLMIVIAFTARLELSRLLRYRLSIPSGIMLMVLVTILCLVAIWSPGNIHQPPLAYAESPMPEASTQLVLELSNNSLGKVLYGELQPVFDQLSTDLQPMIQKLMERVTPLIEKATG